MVSLKQALDQLVQGVTSAELKTAYEKLSQAYRSGRPIKLGTPLLQLAYVQARMPATVAVLTRVLAYLPHEPLKTLVDLGCGPGSVLWAAQDAGIVLKDARCLDQSEGLLELGQKLWESSNQTTTKWEKVDLANVTEAVIGQADLVTLSYVLNELGPAVQVKLLEKAWRSASEFLVLVEPGTPNGFANILRAREYLIGQGAHIVAPCTHENVCPMAGSDWCHFFVRLERTKIHKDIKGTLPYEDEKYSYLIVSKQPVMDRPKARIVKRPSASSGLIELDLCDSDGLSRVKVSKRQGTTYKRARKSEWGDGWVE